MSAGAHPAPLQHRFRPALVKLAVASAFAPMAFAQSASDPPLRTAQILPTVTVTSAREARKDDEVPNSVSVIDEAERERRLANDIRDLIRYEPGVSVRSAPARFTAAGASTGRDGNAGFTIRGIEGNQILIQADGIRLPLAFSFGPIAYGRGDYLDLEAYKTVEILRGPASTLYGSDGLAGAVSFISKDPSDHLARNRDLYLSAKGGYASADESWLGSFTAAARAGAFEGLVVYSRREGQETENQGTNEAPNSTRTAPNPQEIESDNLLAKAVFRPDARNLVRVTGERFRREVATEVLSGRAPPPLVATSVIDLDARDDLARDRVSADYEFSATGAAAIDKAKVTVFRQKTTSLQQSAEDRNTAADRRRDNTYRETADGASVALQSVIGAGGITHRLVYGGDYSVTDIFGLRDGVTPPVGESLPQKPFPDTKYTLYGAFVQDEILMGERLAVIPALRLDGFKLDPATGDPLYPTLGGQPVALDGSRASPKLGAIWRLDAVHSAYAQYASGYRAPTPSQVNQGFENQVANYRSIGNPDLKPETSRTFEVGLRGRSDRYTWDLVAFDGRYEDFIAQIQVRGSFTPSDPAVFQNVNLSKVRIRGFEARGRASWANGWAAFGTFAYARGDDETANQPLASVDPPKLVLGGDYQRETWWVQAAVTRLWEKEASRIPPLPGAPPPASFSTPAATIVDFYAAWRIAKRLTLNAALLNATDRKYWLWSDVRGLSAASPTLDAYTSPGRNYAVSLKLEY